MPSLFSCISRVHFLKISTVKATMDAYAPLLEKTKVPQPSLQKFAVVSIFSKLRTAPNHLDADSEPGREAISNCLQSRSPAVVDQAVRELCRLVCDSKLDLSRGMIELQSALEGTENKFVALFVKGLMFLVRLGFDRSHGSWRFTSSENHPLVKILLCRSEVQPELVLQVLMFMANDRGLGMIDACEFLRPLLNFSVLNSVSLIKPALSEELVLMFPVLNLMSSTSKSVKAAASGLIGVVENCLVHLLKESNPGLCVALKFPHKTTVGTIMYRLLQHLWVQPQVLAMLPSLAAHNMMVPLVIQTIMPMLQMKGKQVLYATGTRLLYHTWAVNDRAFVSLQAALLPNGFSQLKSERTTCISLAASIRDVWKSFNFLFFICMKLKITLVFPVTN
ncbi:Protein RST1 [Linum perenne]